MSKIRINDLARELEVKSKSILDVASGSRSHREEDPFQFPRRPRSGQGPCALPRVQRELTCPAKACAPPAARADEIKTKIDLSHISKPGDVLKAIIRTSSRLRRRPCLLRRVRQRRRFKKLNRLQRLRSRNLLCRYQRRRVPVCLGQRFQLRRPSRQAQQPLCHRL